MNIHLIGIGGIGLSALARFLKFSGFIVSGSDIYTTVITKELEKEGIKVSVPHKKEAINNQDLIIYSAVIKDDNVEMVEAKKQNLNIVSRKASLPFILGDKKVFSVCGAHGKSTTTAILTSILKSSALIGAISKEFNSNFRYVDDVVAFEADESDGSFLLSNPYCSIVTNAEPEHMDYYNYDYDKFYDSYREFLRLGRVKVINAEDKFLSSLDIEAIRLYPSKDIKNIISTIKDNQPNTTFELKDLGKFEVWGFGNHIALNASLAILAAKEILDIEEIRENIKTYCGIKKRFDIVNSKDDYIVIDDYAHHPTEIKATIESITLYNNLIGDKKITLIWQPHKYSRTIDNLIEFKECFIGVDTLIILPVWAAGEDEVFIDFKKEFSKYNPIFIDKVIAKDSLIELIKDKIVIDKIDKGIIVGVGAGDITYQMRIKDIPK